MEKQIGEKEGLKKIDTIENEMYIERERAKADATFYKMTKEIDAQLTQLTPEYLKKLAIESISSNTKLYFGPSIPAFIMENIEGILKHSQVDV